MNLIFRLGGLAVIAILLTLMLGPFQGAEQASGQNDKLLHVLAFVAITASLFVNLPRMSRLQVGGLSLLLGILVEMIQGLTGRDADLADVAADLVGLALVAILGPRRRRF